MTIKEDVEFVNLSPYKQRERIQALKDKIKHLEELKSSKEYWDRII